MKSEAVHRKLQYLAFLTYTWQNHLPHDYFSYSSKPLVCLFPTLFKQNLLTFISLVHQLLPQTAIRDLLVCLSQEPHRSPWVSALISQLERNMGVPSEEPLCTPMCSQRIKQLSQQFVSPRGTRGWADCFGGLVKGSGFLTNSLEQGTQKKRKSSQISLDSDVDETVQQKKRSKMDVSRQECVDAAEQNTKEGTPEKLQSVSSEGTDEKLQPPTDSESLIDALPQHMKVTTDHLICSVKCLFHFQKCN